LGCNDSPILQLQASIGKASHLTPNRSPNRLREQVLLFELDRKMMAVLLRGVPGVGVKWQEVIP